MMADAGKPQKSKFMRKLVIPLIAGGIAGLVSSMAVMAVMDGALDPFIHAWLRAGGPMSRRSAAEREFGDE